MLTRTVQYMIVFERIVVSLCIHLFLHAFHRMCVYSLRHAVCACIQRLVGVILLIQAWRLSDPASNPPAHQISHRCAFVPLSPKQGDHSFPLM